MDTGTQTRPDDAPPLADDHAERQRIADAIAEEFRLMNEARLAACNRVAMLEQRLVALEAERDQLRAYINKRWGQG